MINKVQDSLTDLLLNVFNSNINILCPLNLKSLFKKVETTCRFLNKINIFLLSLFLALGFPVEAGELDSNKTASLCLKKELSLQPSTTTLNPLFDSDKFDFDKQNLYHLKTSAIVSCIFEHKLDPQQYKFCDSMATNKKQCSNKIGIDYYFCIATTNLPEKTAPYPLQIEECEKSHTDKNSTCNDLLLTMACIEQNSSNKARGSKPSQKYFEALKYMKTLEQCMKKETTGLAYCRKRAENQIQGFCHTEKPSFYNNCLKKATTDKDNVECEKKLKEEKALCKKQYDTKINFCNNSFFNSILQCVQTEISSQDLK